MDYQTLEITIQYAEDLNKVNFISKMDVYVVVSISGGDESSKQKTKTPVDHGGDANPTWRFPMKFTVEEAVLLQNRLMLDFEIRCERALGDRVIGEVHVPVKELLDSPAKVRGGAATAKNFVSYQVKKPGGKPKGKLTFSYQLIGKTATSAAQPVAAGGYSLMPSTTAVALEKRNWPYPAAALGLYPPIVPTQPDYGGRYPPPPGYLLAGGMTKPEWYPPQPPPPYSVALPQGYFGHPSPVMQLAPDWWIGDRRYNKQYNGF